MNDLKNISNKKKLGVEVLFGGTSKWPLQSPGFSSQKTRGPFILSSLQSRQDPIFKIVVRLRCFSIESRKNGVLLPRTCATSETTVFHDTKRDFGHPNFFLIGDVGRSTPPKYIIKKSYEITTCSCWMLLAILYILHCFFRHSIGFLDHFDWWNFEGSLSGDRYPSVPDFQSSVKTVFIANLYSEYSNLLC